MNTSAVKRILGFDLGSNNIGHSVVEMMGNNFLGVKCSGVTHISEKISYGSSDSPAADRTKKRSIRHQYSHKRSRKAELIKVLRKYGLCPFVTDSELYVWKHKQIYPNNNEAFMKWLNSTIDANPFLYRSLLVSEKYDMTLEENKYKLGRALYHMMNHRGYKSFRKRGEDKDGDVKKSIESLIASLKEHDFKYYGEYYNYLMNNTKERIHDKRMTQNLVKDEFKVICKVQELDSKIENELFSVLFFNCPPKDQSHKCRRCNLESKVVLEKNGQDTKYSKKCSIISHPLYEEYTMLQFINNIRMDGNELTDEQKETIKPLFFKYISKATFAFKDIIKKLDKERVHEFNFAEDTSVPSCITTARFMNMFGDDYMQGIADRYIHSEGKTKEECFDIIWENLNNGKVADEIVLRRLKKTLQLSDEEAKKLRDNVIYSSTYGKFSIPALKRINRFLKLGYNQYDSVILAKVPDIVGDAIWNEYSEEIINDILGIIDDKKNGNYENETVDRLVKEYLVDRFELSWDSVEKLYNPYEVNDFKPAVLDSAGHFLSLPRPVLDGFNNPSVQKVLNTCYDIVVDYLKLGIIDFNTEIHIEFSREINDKNTQTAIEEWDNEQKKIREDNRKEIISIYRKETGKELEPTEDDILRYSLWKEQNGKCLYTGKTIKVSECVGPDLKFDIEHTIPQCQGGDFMKENLTLCESYYNRYVKGGHTPSELPDYDKILENISFYKTQINALKYAIRSMKTNDYMKVDERNKIIINRKKKQFKLNYLEGKYERFTGNYKPGCALRMGAVNSTASKYLKRWFDTYFKKHSDNSKSNVYLVSGYATAEYRKMWGIQARDEEKDRVNRTNHAIDSVIVACINWYQYSQYCKQQKMNGNYSTFVIPKPWNTFTEDMNNLAKTTIVVEKDDDNTFKFASKKVVVNGKTYKAGGDSVKAPISRSKFYGQKRVMNKKGKYELKCTIRKKLSELAKSDNDSDSDTSDKKKKLTEDSILKELNLIVDPKVRECVIEQFKEYLNESKEENIQKKLKQALCEDYYFYTNKDKKKQKIRHIIFYEPSVKNPIKLKKHRDLSKNELKQWYLVNNKENANAVIYEDSKYPDDITKGKVVVNTVFDAAKSLKQSVRGRVSDVNEKREKMLALLKKHIHVLFYTNSPDEIKWDDNADLVKRLYYIKSIASDGRFTFQHHQCTKSIEKENAICFDVDNNKEGYRYTKSYFNMLIEGRDFTISPSGLIKKVA